MKYLKDNVNLDQMEVLDSKSLNEVVGGIIFYVAGPTRVSGLKCYEYWLLIDDSSGDVLGKYDNKRWVIQAAEARGVTIAEMSLESLTILRTPEGSLRRKMPVA